MSTEVYRLGSSLANQGQSLFEPAQTDRSAGCCRGRERGRSTVETYQAFTALKLHTFHTSSGVTMRSILILAAAAMVSLGAHAQAQQSEQDHASHHPDGGASAAAGRKAPTKSPAKSKATARAASSASGAMGMGMGGDMQQMHKPGGMHDQMHGKDGQMMGGMPAASAASK
ncbi:MAG: hypothetical protein JF586_00150 [Burkholderiales bacterium]|nr:hypothetical protein [Burkholderiales bacterium]